MEVRIWAPPHVTPHSVSIKLNEWMRKHPSKPPFVCFLQDYVSSAWPILWHLATPVEFVVDVERRTVSPVCSSGVDSELCSICHGVLDCGTEQLVGCAHVFHTMCIHRWLRYCNTCPLCRRTIE